jgi:hypothetical protein
MKKSVLGVLSFPYPNKYVVTVTRGDGKHVPTVRAYTCFYDNKRVWSLYNHFVILNALVQKNLLVQRHVENGK